MYVTIHRIFSGCSTIISHLPTRYMDKAVSVVYLGNLPEPMDDQDQTVLTVVSADCYCCWDRHGHGTVISSPCFLCIRTHIKHRRIETVTQWSGRAPKSVHHSPHFCKVEVQKGIYFASSQMTCHHIHKTGNNSISYFRDILFN